MKYLDKMGTWRRVLYFALLLALIGAVNMSGQQQNSGGQAVTISGSLPAGAAIVGKVGIDQTTPGTTNLVSIGTGGHVIIDSGSTTAVTGNVTVAQATGSNLHVAVDSAPTTTVSGTVANGTGVANIGIVRSVPSACTQSTNFTNSTVGVATAAGTSVTSTTTCVTDVYVNNITNSAVTFRLADKTGTPIIWIGGNADFTIPANSNVRFPLGGVTFANGITAIAGTGSALNLQVNGLQ